MKRKQAKKSTASAPRLWVAVVWSGESSARPSGGFEAWVGKSRAEVISQAMAAKHRWDNPRPFGKEYRVLVGPLLQEAHAPITFELGPIEP